MMNKNIKGIALNPWGEKFFIEKYNIEKIFESNIDIPEKNVFFDDIDIRQFVSTVS